MRVRPLMENYICIGPTHWMVVEPQQVRPAGRWMRRWWVMAVSVRTGAKVDGVGGWHDRALTVMHPGAPCTRSWWSDE